MKTILITGATDGIGLETAKMFAENGHTLLLHGRSAEKLAAVQTALMQINANITVDIFRADLSILAEVQKLADDILNKYKAIDVVINNAGVFVVSEDEAMTGDDELDVRFAVNTIAPYILTKRLLPTLNDSSRVINLASAAQAPVDFAALTKYQPLAADEAYAQSKLALIMWSIELAKGYPKGPMVIAVNPKSFLGSKMVKHAYGKNGYDLKIGADILFRAALSQEFANANGKYFDNDYGTFANPHPYALSEINRLKLIHILDSFLS